MDPATAQTLLKEMLCHLPAGWWIMLREKEEHDLSLPKIFNRPRAEVKALLVNAGICNETGNGYSVIKKKRDAFCATHLPAPIQVQTFRKEIYVANGVDKYRTPGNQKEDNARGADCVQLRDNLVESLRKSAQHYDQQNANSAEQQKEDARLAKIQADAAAKLEREELIKTLQYPLLSKIVDAGDDITLDNEQVREWAQKALLEIVRLHDDVGKDLSFTAANGRDVSLLQVPCSKDCNSFVTTDSTTKWIRRGINMSIGNGMSLTDGIGCVRNRLDVYEQNIVSDKDTSSESDGEHK